MILILNNFVDITGENMPVLFDVKKLTFCEANIKSCTTALGGAARVFISDDNPRGERIDIPFHLARMYMKEQKGGDYLVPRKSEIIMYDGKPICFESFPYSAYKTNTMEEIEVAMDIWSSRARRTLEQHIIPFVLNSENIVWYIDGYAFYGLPDKEYWEEDSVPLNSTGTFRRMRVPVLVISDFGRGDVRVNDTESLIVERDCLVFKAPDNELYITPPIWNNLGRVGSRKLETNDNDDVDHTLFDYIDEQLHVNISFALDAAMKITTLFGYEKAEPLQLPELMIEYQTLNLLRMPNAVKQTAPCGIQFTHVMSWLMGLFKDPHLLHDMLEYRSILKNLTTKGLQTGDVMSDDMIYLDGKSKQDVPMLTFNEIETLRVSVIPDLPYVA